MTSVFFIEVIKISIVSRYTEMEVIYNKRKLNEELSEHIRDFTYTDNLSGAIDDIQIELEDMSVKWLNDWFPSKGDEISATILKKYWASQTVKSVLGKFEIDELEGGGPSTSIVLKALAVPENNSLRGEEKSKAWEKAKLKTVFEDIAKKNKLKLYWQSAENPEKDRYEQEEETDLAFLYRCANEEGLCLKIANGSIVVLDEVSFEKKATAETIIRESLAYQKIQVKDWKFKSTVHGVFKTCRVQSHDASKKQTYKGSYTPTPAPKVGRTLVIKKEVKSNAEANRLAKKELRKANKNANIIILYVISEIHLDAGMTFDLIGFGRMNGKYIATKITTKKRVVEMHLRKCLEGY